MYLKHGGERFSINVGAKTVLTIVENDGARFGALADFTAGYRIFALVRKMITN